jgi:hypothetical protein
VKVYAVTFSNLSCFLASQDVDWAQVIREQTIKMTKKNNFVSTVISDGWFLSHNTRLIPICENFGVSMLQNGNNILVIKIKTRKPFCILKL